MRTWVGGGLLGAVALAGVLAHPGGGWAQSAAAAGTVTPAQLQALSDRITRLEDRDAVENLFSRYMYLHSAFEDRLIPALWVRKGTPGIHAQYSNNGVYNSWDSIMVYHQDRPHPIGKLVFHYSANPLIEVAADGQTAKGLWVVAGVESGLASPAAAAHAPAYMYTNSIVGGKKVWAHTIQLKYGVDFMKQDGRWKIWHFHCFEVSRSPYGMDWITFASKAENQSYSNDLMYFGDDGKPVFMPKPDAPATVLNNPYRTDRSQTLDALPPVPYRTFAETFAY
jgi:hypothetical protein